MSNPNGPDYEWNPERVLTLIERAEDAMKGLDILEELIAAYKAEMQRSEKLEEQLTEIHARGYGSLFADELDASGHRAWMHGPDGATCWCHRYDDA